jgi:hypothetical protein
MVMDAVGSAASAVGEALGILKPDRAKLVIVGDNTPNGPTELECMFNPTEYTLKQSVRITRNPSTNTPGGTPEFSGTSSMTLDLKLFFDDFIVPEGDVTPAISTLLSWQNPTPRSIQDERPCPPKVAFRWGGNPQLDGFSGWIKTATVQYKLFRRDGTPIRADVTLSIDGTDEQAAAQNPTSHASNSRRAHTVIEGDTLHSVAYRELGKARYWRALAELNGIDDPQRLPAGTVLLVPSVADAAREG